MIDTSVQPSKTNLLSFTLLIFYASMFMLSFLIHGSKLNLQRSLSLPASSFPAHPMCQTCKEAKTHPLLPPDHMLELWHEQLVDIAIYWQQVYQNMSQVKACVATHKCKAASEIQQVLNKVWKQLRKSERSRCQGWWHFLEDFWSGNCLI